MKRLGILIAVGVSSLLFTGCGEPDFSQYVKKVTMVDGVAYRIPKQSIHYKSTKSINTFKKEGFECKEGSIVWISRLTVDSGRKFMEERNRELFDKHIAQESKFGRAGCARPITNQEYDFYRGKEMQDAADARASANRTAAYLAAAENSRAARKNLQAAQTAKDVNVNVSGTVNHNVDVYHSGTVNHNVSYYNGY